jgi:glucosamine--fructose-6-phosphate aminotransferase (isomerizing)
VDYTCGVKMKPMNVLAQQMEMVDEYIATHWTLASLEAKSRSFAGRNISQILIGGCGDSHHAALGLELAFGVITGCEVRAMEALRLARYAPLLTGKAPESCLVIGISNSGEIARTIEAIENWNEVGAQTLAYTSNTDNTLAHAAQHSFILPSVDIPHGPGLLSYIGSLLLGYATIVHSFGGDNTSNINQLIDQLPALLNKWVPSEIERGEQFAGKVSDGVAVFLGSGSANGSAHFGAAKVVEAVGERSWAQDVEEWAHLEYFCDPADMPTILLSARGRAHSRELEVFDAMNVLGRTVLRSEWEGGRDWSPLERELLAPLALWAAPCAYASTRAEMLAAEPFRGFMGGRDRREGGGASRIRSSKRMDLDDLDGER